MESSVPSLNGRFAITKPAAPRGCDPPHRSGFLEFVPITPGRHPTLADRAFALLKADPYHPSLHFKRIDVLWSVRIGLHYRALGAEIKDGILWFWIGTHADYDRMTG